MPTNCPRHPTLNLLHAICALALSNSAYAEDASNGPEFDTTPHIPHAFERIPLATPTQDQLQGFTADNSRPDAQPVTPTSQRATADELPLVTYGKIPPATHYPIKEVKTQRPSTSISAFSGLRTGYFSDQLGGKIDWTDQSGAHHFYYTEDPVNELYLPINLPILRVATDIALGGRFAATLNCELNTKTAAGTMEESTWDLFDTSQLIGYSAGSARANLFEFDAEFKTMLTDGTQLGTPYLGVGLESRNYNYETNATAASNPASVSDLHTGTDLRYSAQITIPYLSFYFTAKNFSRTWMEFSAKYSPYASTTVTDVRAKQDAISHGSTDGISFKTSFSLNWLSPLGPIVTLGANYIYLNTEGEATLTQNSPTATFPTTKIEQQHKSQTFNYYLGLSWDLDI